MNDKHLPPTPLHLDTAFSDIAASAGAAATDGTTGTLEVRRLVKRSRRQRATALGASGFVVLGLAGVGLSGLLTPAPVEILPAPPVTPSPTASVEPLPGTFAPVCGDDLSEVLATTTPLTLGPDPADLADETPFQVTNTGDGPLTVRSTGPVTVYLLDAEGTVVSSPPAPDGSSAEQDPTPLDLALGATGELGISTVGPCGDGAPPAAGTYTAVGTLATEITPADGTPAARTVVGGPWIVTVDDQGRITSLDGHALALPAEPETPPVAQEPPPTFLPGAFDGEKVTFPAPQTMDASFQCGQPAPTATGDGLLARLEVVGRVPVVSGTSQPSVAARVTTDPHARVEVVDWFFLYEYVISQDGVIVSSSQTATDTYGDVELEPGRTVDSQFLLAATATCGNPAGDPVPLAPGTYQLHATLPWMIGSYALQQTDGTWGRTQQAQPGDFLFKGTLVSAPVTFTVQ